MLRKIRTLDDYIALGDSDARAHDVLVNAHKVQYVTEVLDSSGRGISALFMRRGDSIYVVGTLEELQCILNAAIQGARHGH